MIVILAKSTFDLETLFKTATQVLGRKINGTIDAKSIKKDTLKNYTALSEILDCDYSHSVSLDTRAIDHITYTLAFGADYATYVELLHYNYVQYIGTESTKRDYYIVIATGSLRDWRSLVIDGCSKSVSNEIRSITNEIYNTFVIEGLSGLWSDYSKKQYNNAIILIENKK